MFNVLSCAARRLALTAVVLCPLLSLAARPVDPPSVEMTRGENNVIAATVLDKPDLTHLVVRVEDVLSGEAEGELTLRSKAEYVGRIAVGRRYLIAFTRLANDDQFRDAKFIDPEGPRILELRGLRDAAVLDDAAAARFLFRRARGEDQPSDRERLDAIMALIRSGDERTRGFAIEELYLRNELPPVMAERDTRELAVLVRDPALMPQLRQFVADATLSVPERADQPWLLNMDRAVVGNAAMHLDLATARPLLVVTAIRGVRAYGSEDDVVLLLPLLEANAPEVAIRALEAADALDRAATQQRVAQLIEALVLREGVHADVRRALERYFVEAQLQAAGRDEAG